MRSSLPALSERVKAHATCGAGGHVRMPAGLLLHFGPHGPGQYLSLSVRSPLDHRSGDTPAKIQHLSVTHCCLTPSPVFSCHPSTQSKIKAQARAEKSPGMVVSRMRRSVAFRLTLFPDHWRQEEWM